MHNLAFPMPNGVPGFLGVCAPVAAPGCPEDLDGDGVVDAADLARCSARGVVACKRRTLT